MFNCVQITRPNKSELILIGLGFIGLVILILIGNKFQCSDEIPYLSNVGLLHKYGLGNEFLIGLQGSAGPLYSVVHYLFEPITRLQPPGIRFVNILFLGLTVCVLGLLLRRLGYSHWTYSFFILAVPKMYVINGLAFTEMPAIFFYTASIFFVLKAAEPNVKLSARTFFSIACGLCLSLAILGRQPFLLTLAAVPILFLRQWNTKSLLLLFVIFVTALMLPCYVFWQWQGWMPPSDKIFYPDIPGQLNLRPDFFILCIFYVAIAFMILAPALFKIKNTKEFLFIVSGAVFLAILNLSFNLISYLPFAQIASKLPSHLIAKAEILFGWVFICVSSYFVYKLFQSTIAQRNNIQLIFLIVSLLLLCFASARITWGFTSRYSVQAIPLIILIASIFYRHSRLTFVLVSVGIATGLFSLYSYYG